MKDDNEEEIAQFDGEIVKKVMINDASTFLSTVNNLKVPQEGFWLGGDKYRVTRTDEIPDALLSRVLSCQFRRFGRKLRRLSVFSKYELPNAVLSIAVPVPQIQEQRVEVQRDNPQERLQLRSLGTRQRLQNV